jgi:hypothetical protein
VTLNTSHENRIVFSSLRFHILEMPGSIPK